MRHIAAALACLILISPARACSVPVFRFALERWPAGRFVLRVHHDGPLTPEQQRRLTDINSADANLVVKVAASKQPPRVVLSHPKDDTPVWDQPLDSLDARGLCQSPARAELVRLLAGGASGVWILLECGDATVDGAAEALVRKELARLEKVLELPPPHETEPHLLSPLPLVLSFAVLKVRRDDPAEAFLVRQLLDVDDDLDKVKGPLVFPTFGRGLVLAPMHGAGIRAKEVEADAKFLCGPCSCEAKKDNPGRDLLLAADWLALLKMDREPGDERKGLPAPRIAPGVKEEQEAVSPPGSPVFAIAAVAAAVLALLAAVLALRRG